MAVKQIGEPLDQFDLVDLSSLEAKDPNTMPLNELRDYMMLKERNATVAAQLAARLNAGKPVDTGDAAGFVATEKYNEFRSTLPSVIEFQQMEMQTFRDRNPRFKETQENCDMLAQYARKHFTQDPHAPITALHLQSAYNKLHAMGVLDE